MAKILEKENIDKAQVKSDYLSGMKIKEIADKYNVSLNTLKSWIKRYKWSEEKKKGAPLPKKQGAPLGNKNAVGAGAPQTITQKSMAFLANIFRMKQKKYSMLSVKQIH